MGQVKRSSIGLMEEQLYVAPNGCYVVRSTTLGPDVAEQYDLRTAAGEYLGDGIYGSLEAASRGADKGGETFGPYGQAS